MCKDCSSILELYLGHVRSTFWSPIADDACGALNSAQILQSLNCYERVGSAILYIKIFFMTCDLCIRKSSFWLSLHRPRLNVCYEAIRPNDNDGTQNCDECDVFTEIQSTGERGVRAESGLETRSVPHCDGSALLRGDAHLGEPAVQARPRAANGAVRGGCQLRVPRPHAAGVDRGGELALRPQLHPASSRDAAVHDAAINARPNTFG